MRMVEARLSAAGDGTLYGRCADHFTVVDDRQALADICFGDLGKLLGPLVGQCQLYHIILAACGAVGLGTGLCRLDIRSRKDGLPVLILEFQGTRFAQLLQDLVGV